MAFRARPTGATGPLRCGPRGRAYVFQRTRACIWIAEDAGMCSHPQSLAGKPPESTGLLEPSKSCPMVPSLHQNQLSASVASCSHIICSWLLLLQPIDCCVNKHVKGTKLCWFTLQSQGSFKALLFIETFHSLSHYFSPAHTCNTIVCRLSISQLRSCLQDSFPAGLTSSVDPFHPMDFRSTQACQTEYTLIALDWGRRNFWL